MEHFQWPAQGATQLVCQRKWFETPDCASFILAAPEQAQPFTFIAGQFITLGVDINGTVEHRAYSISSTPNQCHLQITVKRVDGGTVSNYLIDQLTVGEQLNVLKPSGEFHLNQPHGDKVLLVSAGCGITPLMSMARTLLADPNNDTNIHFIHAATCLEQIIYHDELIELSNSHKRFKLDITLEDASNTHYQQGRLTQAALAKFCPDIANRSGFLCGPVGFMEAVQESLQALHMDMSHFYHESFTPSSAQSSADNSASAAETGTASADPAVNVFVPSFGAQAEVAHGSLLLDALEAEKLPVIAACRSGVCGSCKSKVTKGDFTRTSVATLTEQELAEGYVLACSCQIESDIEVALN